MATFDKERPQKPRHEAVSTLNWQKKDIMAFFKFLHKKVSQLHKKASAHFFYNFWGFNLKKSWGKASKCRKNISYSKKLFSAEIWKMPGCHFCTNVMLKQSHVQASRASPGQKWPDLRVFISKTFQGLHFLFSGPLRLTIYIYLLVKQIWWKAQCE